MKKFNPLILILWLVLVVSSSIFIGVWHKSDFSAKKSFSQKKIEQRDKWQLVHFLGGECQCSEYITNYLVKRGPSSNYEKVIVFDDVKKFASRLKAAGFNVESLEYDKVKTEEKPDGIPILLIASPNGEVKYEGGYSDRMLTPFSEIKDLKKIEDIKNEPSRKVAQLPAYGCYMSKKYKKWLDPAGLKY